MVFQTKLRSSSWKMAATLNIWEMHIQSMHVIRKVHYVFSTCIIYDQSHLLKNLLPLFKQEVLLHDRLWRSSLKMAAILKSCVVRVFFPRAGPYGPFVSNVLLVSYFESISKQMSLPPFIFLEAIRHIRYFLIDKVFKETLWSLSNHTYGTHKCAGFWW